MSCKVVEHEFGSSAPRSPANWRALAWPQKSIATCSNGTTAAARDARASTSTPSALTGCYSATVNLGALDPTWTAAALRAKRDPAVG